MSKLKLAKLPNRTPVKLTVTISPDLNQKLTRYADVYNETYGNTTPEPVSELVPYILEGFLDNDKMFAKEMKRKPDALTVTASRVASARGAAHER